MNRRPPPSSPACPQDSAAIPARWSRRTLLAGLAATASLMAANLRPAAAQQSTPPTGSASPTPVGPARTALLPRQAMLSLAEVQEIIPAFTSETRTSLNLTAMGSPAANRAVTYATPDATQQLVLSVDQYGSADEASGAFQEGVQATQGVPGVTMEAVPALGDGGVIGVVSLGGETHVGGAAAFDNLIVNATLQGFDGTPATRAAVLELIRRQAAHAGQFLAMAATPARET